MTWCTCGHSDTSHLDGMGGCRALVSNLAGQTNDCACEQFVCVKP